MRVRFAGEGGLVIAKRQQGVIEVYNSVQGAAFFQRLMQEWADGGAQVRAHFAISESHYRVPRGPVGRLVRRWQMYGGYAWTSWRQARKRLGPPPVRIVTTNPFFAPALVCRVAGPDATTINLLYDLFPEALVQTGTIKSNSWIANRCADITRYALRECAATVFLGERLRAYAESTYGPARRAVIIPVGADGGPFRDAWPQLLDSSIAPRILYSGQMGSMHDTGTLIGAWPDLANHAVVWSFYASGSGFMRLRQTVDTRTGVTWGGALPESDWQREMKQAQVALITVAAGAERVVMPSKTYSALVAGQAILAVCRRESDLADLVFRHDCGWVVEPGDIAGFKCVLADIASDSRGLWKKRQRAFAAGHRYYDMTPVAAEWAKLMAELKPRSVRPPEDPENQAA